MGGGGRWRRGAQWGREVAGEEKREVERWESRPAQGRGARRGGRELRGAPQASLKKLDSTRRPLAGRCSPAECRGTARGGSLPTSFCERSPRCSGRNLGLAHPMGRLHLPARKVGPTNALSPSSAACWGWEYLDVVDVIRSNCAGGVGRVGVRVFDPVGIEGELVVQSSA